MLRKIGFISGQIEILDKAFNSLLKIFIGYIQIHCVIYTFDTILPDEIVSLINIPGNPISIN